jgi:hypothetical protein
MKMTEELVNHLEELNEIDPWGKDKPSRVRDKYMQQTQVAALCAIADLMMIAVTELATLVEIKAQEVDSD